MLFQDFGLQRVEADFSGGHLSGDGGALLLGQIDRGLGLSRLLAACFEDRRDPQLVEHSIEELVRQRVTAIALGYEDLNDHADLRRDPLLAAVVGKSDVLGQKRRMPKDRGAACASPATLNRLELGAEFSDRYRKLKADPQKVEAALLEAGVRCLPKDQELFVLDFDATDMPLHGQQEGRFFHGYYDHYCYLPLYCFCGPVAMWAQLRPSGTDASEGTVEALTKIVAANQMRLWFSAMAYLLVERLRSLALCGGDLAAASLGSVRLRLLKVAAAVKISARRVHVALCSAFPLQDVFRKAQQRLSQLQKAPA